MRKILGGLATLLAIGASGWAQAQSQAGIDQQINDAIKPAADAVAGFIFSAFPVAGVDIPFVLVWLIVAATIFTFYFRFINFRAFKHGFQLVRGDYNDPHAAGEVERRVSREAGEVLGVGRRGAGDRRGQALGLRVRA